jgi:hypothetical protein
MNISNRPLIAAALRELIAMVDRGVEYPDAHSSAAIAWRLTDDQAAELSIEYDKAQS